MTVQKKDFGLRFYCGMVMPYMPCSKAWSDQVQVTVRLGSNLKSIISLTLVDVKLAILIKSKVLENRPLFDLRHRGDCTLMMRHLV